MEQQFSMNLDGNSMRFAPGGKVAVIDAIKALTATHCAEFIWESLKRERPDFCELCQVYDFPKESNVPVVDNAGWEIIEEVLLDYILDESSVT
jgi:hypothetical protein